MKNKKIQKTPERTDSAQDEEPKKKPEKTVFLKQYMVVETTVSDEKPRQLTAAFILQTCTKTAREEFEQRFGVKAGSCTQTAESDLTKEDLQRSDMWKEKRNWEMPIEPTAQTKSSKAYFETTEKSKRVQAAKREAGIADWDTATEEQLKRVDEILSQEKK